MFMDGEGLSTSFMVIKVIRSNSPLNDCNAVKEEFFFEVLIIWLVFFNIRNKNDKIIKVHNEIEATSSNKTLLHCRWKYVKISQVLFFFKILK